MLLLVISNTFCIDVNNDVARFVHALDTVLSGSVSDESVSYLMEFFSPRAHWLIDDKTTVNTKRLVALTLAQVGIDSPTTMTQIPLGIRSERIDYFGFLYETHCYLASGSNGPLKLTAELHLEWFCGSDSCCITKGRMESL